MESNIRKFTYNYPRDLVFDAVVYAVKKNSLLGMLFHDKKAGYIGTIRAQSIYIKGDQLVTIAVRNENDFRTDIVIVFCYRQANNAKFINKQNTLFIVKLNKMIKQYLGRAMYEK